MVLSNKKLKQKIREELANLLVASQVQTHPNGSSSNKTQSFKSLLEAAASARKPKLSKREIKRVKPQPSLPESTNKPVRDEGNNVNPSPPFKESTGIGAEDVVKIDSLQEINKEGIGEDGGNGVHEGKKREKKRKRESKEGGEKENDGEKLAQKKSSKKKMKKKYKKKNKVEKGDNLEDENKGKEIVHSGFERPVVATAMQIDDSKEHENYSTKVYVGGIPYYSTEEDIRSFFEGCGTITEVDCLYFPETGKFKGIAMISFKTEAAAKRALALDGSDMGGLFLKIQPYKASKDTKVSDFAPAILEGYNRIYIGNLSWDITEDEIKKLFSDCTISSIRFGKDKETGEFRGYAHVDFADSLSLSIALKLDQQIVCGRPVRIRCAVPPKVGKPNSKPMLTSKKADDSIPVFRSKRSEDLTPAPSCNIAEVTKSVNPTNMDAEDYAVSDTSRKMNRRTCYECGEKGHLSSACPTSEKVKEPIPLFSSKMHVPTSKADDIISRPAANVDAEDHLLNSTLSGKMRRRTCYECGEKGHLSSACPTSKKAEESFPLSSGKKAEDMMPVPTHKGDDMKFGAAPDVDAEDNLVNSTLTGKIRRRTCYECGEKGHLSSACPTSNKAESLILPVSSSKKAESCILPVSSSTKGEDSKFVPPSKKADDINPGPSPSVDVEANMVNSTLSGKIRRRTCYECGEKGHLSSACPKKLASDQTNSTAT